MTNSFKCELENKSQCSTEVKFCTVPTFTYISHLQVLVGANAGVSEQGVFNCKRAPVLPVATVN